MPGQCGKQVPRMHCAWVLCITSGHAARAKDTSAMSLQLLGRTLALQVTGLHNSWFYVSGPHRNKPERGKPSDLISRGPKKDALTSRGRKQDAPTTEALVLPPALSKALHRS